MVVHFSPEYTRIDDVSNSIYVVRIPKSQLRPHQTGAYRYYKRQNFSVVDMEEYEIRESYVNPVTPVKIVESPQDRAIRIKNETEAEDERQRLIGSMEGLSLAMIEVDKIKPLLQEQKDLMKNKDVDWHIGEDRIVRNPHNGFIEVMSHAVYLKFNYQCKYGNSANDLSLSMSITTGGNSGGKMYMEPFKNHCGVEMVFGINKLNQPGWFSLDKKKFFTTKEVVSDAYGKLIDTVTQIRSRR